VYEIPGDKATSADSFRPGQTGTKTGTNSKVLDSEVRVKKGGLKMR